MKKKFLTIWSFTLLSLSAIQGVSGQALYPSSPALGLQSATLENVMLLQNLRDTDGPCIGRNAWLTAYGLGGFSSGDLATETETGGEETQNSNFRQSLGGFLTGCDLNWGVNSRVGAFMAYNSSTQESRQPSDGEKANIDNYLWGFYGRKDLMGSYVLGTAAIGHSHLNEKLNQDSGSSFGGTSNAWRAFLYGEWGTEFRHNDFSLQPFGGLQYYYSSFGSFTSEDLSSASAGAMTFPALKTNSFRGILGVRAANTFWKNENHSIRGNCTAFWYHEFLDLDEIGGGIFQQNGTEILVSSQDYGRDWVILAPTVEWNFKNLKLWAGYIAMVNSYETLHLGQGGAAFCW